jgi:hypothetical protein
LLASSLGGGQGTGVERSSVTPIRWALSALRTAHGGHQPSHVTPRLRTHGGQFRTLLGCDTRAEVALVVPGKQDNGVAKGPRVFRQGCRVGGLRRTQREQTDEQTGDQHAEAQTRPTRGMTGKFPA